MLCNANVIFSPKTILEKKKIYYKISTTPICCSGLGIFDVKVLIEINKNP